MALALLIFGVAFAASSTWLTVRIVNHHERWAKRTLAAVVGVPVLYVAIFGPACWISSRFGGGKSVGFIFGPVMHVWWHGQPPRGDDQLDRYTRFAAAPGWGMGLDVTSGGYDWGPRP
jgi:predicted MFS family arabinose efflux permease